MTNSFQTYLQRHEKIIGSIASVLAIIMFVSLVEVLLSNLSGNSNIWFQPLATAINGFFWALYAYGRKDWYLLIPNILACSLGIVTTISAFV